VIGMRYVVFVNGRSRPVVMQNMEERIKRGDIEREKVEAIEVRGKFIMNSYTRDGETNHT
jgi:hypothetical protein